MWMHNGGIGGWAHVKRKLALLIQEKWFLVVKGSTDSEWAFALFLDCLSRLGVDPSADPGPGGFGHGVLRKALLQTIEEINALTSAIDPELERGVVSLLNFAITDGYTVVCSRYASSKTDEAASLFFSSGTSWQPPADQVRDKGNYTMERRDRGAGIVLVASEPLTFERSTKNLAFSLRGTTDKKAADNWVTVPTNSTLTIHKQTVMVHPIIDEFYHPEASHKRSTKLAREMGQMSSRATAAVEVGAPVFPHQLDSPLDTSANALAVKLQELKTQAG